MPSTRDRALDAAVRLVGEQGVRALTHARVDAEAGLPRGSTSNWFRTRDALVAGVIVRIAEQERADLVTAIAPTSSADELVDALCRLLEDATGRHATRTRARYALFLETTAAGDTEESMHAERSAFAAWTRDVLTGLGAPDPDAAARTLLAVSAGLIVNRLTVDPDAELRPVVEVAVRGALAAPAAGHDPT
jgi:DNA-binding transcriptional regulator YbjK